MVSTNYYCVGCNFKTNNVSNLVKKKGCASCGRSGIKCPNCGMSLKMVKTGSSTVINKINSNPIKSIETSKSERKINVKKI